MSRRTRVREMFGWMPEVHCLRGRAASWGQRSGTAILMFARGERLPRRTLERAPEFWSNVLGHRPSRGRVLHRCQVTQDSGAAALSAALAGVTLDCVIHNAG